MDFWNLFEALYPIQRTVLGEGVEQSLQILQRFGVALKVLSLPSGTPCGSWTVPDEWRVRKAELRTVTGKVILDYSENPHCLWHHSAPFCGKVSRRELLQDHLRWTERAPLATPLVVTYYKRRWGFSAPHPLVQSLTDPEYVVEIDTSFGAGQMAIGLAELAGSTGRAILFDAVISCGSLANNLSGVVALAELYRRVAALPARRLTYRFIWSPETIGPIALAYHFPRLLDHAIGGINLQNLADRGNKFLLKKSRPGDTVVDRALAHVLKTRNLHFDSESYSVLTGECGNEKAYNSLGI